MTEILTLTPPLRDEIIASLCAGDRVNITGMVYTARDAAHQRLVDALDAGQPPPIDLAGQIIYYTDPTPPPPPPPTDPPGPTTARRMDPYTPRLLAAGVKATIGKGERSTEVREALRERNALYLTTIPGAGALLARHIVGAEVVAYQDLGPEAIYRLNLKEFPAIVANDTHWGDIFEEGVRRYRVP